MKKIIALIVLVLMLATACNSGTDSAPDVNPNNTVGANAWPTDDATVPDLADPAVDDDAPETGTFGGTFTYEDGLVVKVGVPTTFKPSEYAMADPANVYIEFDITIVNGTGKLYDPSMFMTTLQSGDTEGSDVYDSDKGFNGSPETKILPNRQSKFKVGYGATSMSQLVLDVTPGFEYNDSLFAN